MSIKKEWLDGQYFVAIKGSGKNARYALVRWDKRANQVKAKARTGGEFFAAGQGDAAINYVATWYKTRRTPMRHYKKARGIWGMFGV